jgi:hypothetical protein
LRIAGAHLPSLGYHELDTGHGKLSGARPLCPHDRTRPTGRALAQEHQSGWSTAAIHASC